MRTDVDYIGCLYFNVFSSVKGMVLKDILDVGVTQAKLR